MSRKRPINRDDLRSVLFLLILFVSTIGGRELGNFFSSYESLTDLKVLFEVSEEELSRYLIATLEGRDTPLNVGYSITSKRADNTIDIVTTQPDYVKRWIIGLTVAPIKVNQPEASDVDFEMLVEDVLVDKEVYSFPREKVSFLGLRDRKIEPTIDDLESLRDMIQKSVEDFSGEVKVTFRGRVNVHLLFLDTWLPFEVTRHTLVTIPYLVYTDSSWKNLDGSVVETIEAGNTGYVLVNLENPTRIHSLQENYILEFYSVDDSEASLNVSKDMSVAPMTEGQYVFQYRFDIPGEYRYRIISDERVILELEDSLVLTVE